MVGNLKFDGANHDRKHPEVLQRAEQLGLLSNPQASEVGTGTTQTQRSDLQANRPMVWICGSTQDPEERICLDTFCELIDRFPHLRLILVPRHAERFEEVAKLVRDKRVAWGRRSRMADEPLDPNWKVFLADSVGELRWWWGLADLGFVGGSFGARGGQNMIEPCAYSVAVCFGPNTRNFADVVQILLDAEAATQLASPEELKPWVVRMIEDSPTRSLTARRAESITSEHRGATERTWKQLAVLVQRQVQSTAP